MPQMSAIWLKALLCKIVDIVCTHLLGDYLNFLSDNWIQCGNGVRVVVVDFVIEETPEETWAFKSGKWGTHST